MKFSCTKPAQTSPKECRRPNRQKRTEPRTENNPRNALPEPLHRSGIVARLPSPYSYALPPERESPRTLFGNRRRTTKTTRRRRHYDGNPARCLGIRHHTKSPCCNSALITSIYRRRSGRLLRLPATNQPAWFCVVCGVGGTNLRVCLGAPTPGRPDGAERTHTRGAQANSG